MIIIDILVAAYFFYVRKIARKGLGEERMLEASTYGVSLLSTPMIFSALVYVKYLINIKLIRFTPLMVTFSIVLIAEITKRNVVNIADTFPRILLYIIPLIHWIISSFLLFLSFRYLN